MRPGQRYELPRRQEGDLLFGSAPGDRRVLRNKRNVMRIIKGFGEMQQIQNILGTDSTAIVAARGSNVPCIWHWF